MKGTTFGIGQLSPSEKSDILRQHKHIYNGYKTMYPEVSNTQPLYVYDAAGDKDGITVNNKGEVMKYTNMGINEQTEQKEVCDECGAMQMSEGVCNECGWKGNSKPMEEDTFDNDLDDEIEDFEDKPLKSLEKKLNKFDLDEPNKKFRPKIDLGKSFEKFKTKMDEIGHLDDIYDEQDLDPKAGFDYIEGSSNDVDTFEDMHKKLYEDDELEEQGGNADDMDTDDVEPAYNFDSGGPEMGNTYPVNEDGDSEDYSYEQMESAWADDELDETGITGTQGIYTDMKSAYDFDSEGPGKAGPYQIRKEDFEDDDQYFQDDTEEDELNLDLTKFNPEDKSWEEIKAHTGDDDWSEIDEDLSESFIKQKNRITEMMTRMNGFN